MDYREWGHDSRDPLDRVAAPQAWSAQYEADDDYDDEPRQRHGHDTSAGTGWVPGARHAPDDSGYLTDPRYRPRFPASRDDESRSGGGRALDRGEWREIQPLAGPPRRPPAIRRPAEPAPRARRGPPGPRRPRYDEPEDDEPQRGFLSAVALTAIWYVVPVGLFVVWAFMLGSVAEPGCVDPAGNPCAAPRAEALDTLVETLPRLATAVGLSLAIALIIRWSKTTWRTLTIGFAAAVVGAGVTTVFFSVIAGSPAA